MASRRRSTSLQSVLLARAVDADPLICPLPVGVNRKLWIHVNASVRREPWTIILNNDKFSMTSEGILYLINNLRLNNVINHRQFYQNYFWSECTKKNSVPWFVSSYIHRRTHIYLIKYDQSHIIINETFQLSDNLKIGFESVMLSSVGEPGLFRGSRKTYFRGSWSQSR